MNCCQLVYLAPQLLISLLIQAAIFDIDGDYTSHNLYKAEIILRKITRFAALDADYTYQTLGIAKENNR